jgi:nicotinamidase-related amidase
MPTDESRAPLAEEHAAGGTALLIIDMLSDWRFDHGAELLANASAIAASIAALKARCRQAGVPVVYVNDNRGRWRSNFSEVAQYACEQAGEGGLIARMLLPKPEVYCVLKPKHSGFYATPLELLLRHLRVGQIVLTGVSTEHCVSMTATDACIRDFKVWCPEDAVASHDAALRDRTLAQLRESVRACTAPSDTLRLPDLGEQ